MTTDVIYEVHRSDWSYQASALATTPTFSCSSCNLAKSSFLVPVLAAEIKGSIWSIVYHVTHVVEDGLRVQNLEACRGFYLLWQC